MACALPFRKERLELQEPNRVRRQTTVEPAEEEKPEEEDEIDQTVKEVSTDPKPADNEPDPEIKPSNREDKQIPAITDDEEIAQVDEIEPETSRRPNSLGFPYFPNQKCNRTKR